jgi:hypothetical protein
MCKLNRPKASCKDSSSEEKETNHIQRNAKTRQLNNSNNNLWYFNDTGISSDCVVLYDNIINE